MAGEVVTQPNSTAQPRSWSDREYRECREHAEDALRAYAESMRFWNEPDIEHSRLTLRALVEQVIAEELA